MNELVNSIAVLGKPYSVTKSRLGAITKIYEQQYLCDHRALQEIFQALGEKLSAITPIKTPEFSFLISFSDRTHHDGVTKDLQQLARIPTGKQTERVVMRWLIDHMIDGVENQLTITIRIANPINPFMFLQAALSKSANDLDNFEFETGSTCVTVDGADQRYADEVFLLVQKWIDARNKPHPFIRVQELYVKYEWMIDQISFSILPFISVCAGTFAVGKYLSFRHQIIAIPILLAGFFVVRSLSRKVNQKMAEWARRASTLSVFLLTNGDDDAVTKAAARSKNSVIKLSVAGALNFLLSLLSGYICWLMTRP